VERKISTPSLLLFIILVGFPQISETIYTPSLPDIASWLQASGNAIQLTLSIYFLGFALGVFCWGRLSDSIGRRSAMLWGILVYGLGSLGCYFSASIEWLLLSRFIQAFGASTGSVVTQTILRESIDGAKRHAVFAQISAALAFSPAIGPLIGGWVDQSLGFRAVFFTLVLMSVAIFMYTFTSLPETRVPSTASIRTTSVAKRLITDRRVWSFGFLIGATNGILFSYYAEAPFIFIEFFGMTPGAFGFFGIFVALSSVFGAMLSKKTVSQHCGRENHPDRCSRDDSRRLMSHGFHTFRSESIRTLAGCYGCLYLHPSSGDRDCDTKLPELGACSLWRCARHSRCSVWIGLLRCSQSHHQRHELSA